MDGRMVQEGKKAAPRDDSERFVSAVLLSATIDGRNHLPALG
jgi:hypothetical protein